MFNDLLKVQDDLTLLYLEILRDEKDIGHVKARILDIIQDIYKTVDETVAGHAAEHGQETRKQDPVQVTV